MENKENNSPLPAYKVVSLLAQKFHHEYEDAIKDCDLPQQLELTEHLLNVLELLEQYAENQDDAVYKQFAEQEEALLKKYRKTLNPYWIKQFYTYFSFDTVLHEKGIYSAEKFNQLPLDQQRLSLSEVTSFVRICTNTLNNARTYLYLRMEPENSPKETVTETTTIQGQAEPDREFTRARQLLAIYYLMKAGWEIEHRDNRHVSTVARFAHLLTGTRITILQNSDIYKKYSEMPDFKKDEQLIDDLRLIRPFFEEMRIEKAVQLIDEKIRQVIEGLPLIRREKYRNKGE